MRLGFGGKEHGLAADADALTRSHEAGGLGLVPGRVHGDGGELVGDRLAVARHEHVRVTQVDAALLKGEPIGGVVVPG